MRTTAVFLLLALALAPAAQAQDASEEYQFDESSFVRVAVGDVPRTNATEEDGLLHVVEYVRLDHDGNQTQLTFDAERAGGDLSVGCDCGSASRSGDTITVGSDVEAGEVVVALTHSHPFAGSASVPFAFEHDDVVLRFFLAPEYGVSSSAKATMTLGGLGFNGTTTQFATTDAWFTVHAAGMDAHAESETIIREVPVGDGGIDALSVVVGLVAGVALWFVLVQQGMVQKRRKQEVAVAAHKEVASQDSKEVLEGRKRLLMAALKDLEMARMNKEVDDAAYDALKAEFKKKTVTTMRAIEEAS